jgi:hypothetical protein
MSALLFVWGAVSTRVRQEQTTQEFKSCFPSCASDDGDEVKNGPLLKSRVSPWCSRYTRDPVVQVAQGVAMDEERPKVTILEQRRARAKSHRRHIWSSTSSARRYGSALWGQPLSAKRPACPAGTADALGWWCPSTNFVWNKNGGRNSLTKRFGIFEGRRLGLSEQHGVTEAERPYFYISLSSLPRHSDSRDCPSFGSTASNRKQLQLRGVYRRIKFSSAIFTSCSLSDNTLENIPPPYFPPPFQKEFWPR